MTFTPNGNFLLGQRIEDTSTTAKHALGTRVFCKDPDYGAGEFIYLKGVASTLLGSWSTINSDDWTTTLIVANAIGDVGVSMSANVANQYGWYQIYGKASAQAAASYADNGLVFIASSGVVDDAVVDGDMVHNAKGASTITSAGLADFEIAYPYTDDITTND